jgi:hypothetical protein
MPKILGSDANLNKHTAAAWLIQGLKQSDKLGYNEKNYQLTFSAQFGNRALSASFSISSN